MGMIQQTINTPINGSWVCPAGVTSLQIISYRSLQYGSTSYNASGLSGNVLMKSNNSTHIIDATGRLIGWGNGTMVGANAASSSKPIANSDISQTGFLGFSEIITTAGGGYAIARNGSLFTWGNSANGERAAGNIASTSNPGAVVTLALSCFKLRGGVNQWATGGSVQTNGSLFVLATDGAAYAWGINTQGQLGVGDVIPRSSPVAVLGGFKFQELYTNGANSVGLTNAGVAYAWGYNLNGELGVGDVVVRSSPVAVLGSLTLQSLVVAQGVTLGLTTAGAAYAWGLNNKGCLGLGDILPRSSPIAVLGGLTFKALYVSNANGSFSATNTSVPTSSYGLTTAGALYAWGDNTNGQLGLGDVVARSSPVAVLGGLNFTSIVPDNMGFVLGITTSGAMYAWGVNTNGQLGVGDVIPRSSPVAVLGGLTFTGAATDSSNGSVTAVSSTGVVYGWGANSYPTAVTSIIGNNSTTPASSPVAVLSNLTAALNPVAYTQNLVVTPGTTYNIKFGPGLTTFGTLVIGTGYTDTLILRYSL